MESYERGGTRRVHREVWPSQSKHKRLPTGKNRYRISSGTVYAYLWGRVVASANGRRKKAVTRYANIHADMGVHQLRSKFSYRVEGRVPYFEQKNLLGVNRLGLRCRHAPCASLQTDWRLKIVAIVGCSVRCGPPSTERDEPTEIAANTNQLAKRGRVQNTSRKFFRSRRKFR
jgi:hypothetical protein